MNKTQERVKKVLENMGRMIGDDSDYADTFSHDLDVMLDDLAGDDAFGTEGQCDPRGDGRNGDFSMAFVEGIDT